MPRKCLLQRFLIYFVCFSSAGAWSDVACSRKRDLPNICDFPQLDRAIPTPAGKRTPVGRESQCIHPVLVPVDGMALDRPHMRGLTISGRPQIPHVPEPDTVQVIVTTGEK